MIFEETFIPGVYQITLDKKGDSRGFFARAFCKKEYSEHGLNSEVVQMNNSLTAEKYTLRGLHYQLPPHSEERIVRCLQGALYDVCLDLRVDSPTFGKYFGIELNPENRTMMYIPKGCAHGFMTLKDNTEMLYMVTEYYAPESERVIRWNDPKFNIEWPHEPLVISDKDKNAVNYNPTEHNGGMNL